MFDLLFSSGIGWVLLLVIVARVGLKTFEARRFGNLSTLGELNALSPEDFEEFVADMFRRKGSKASVVGGQGDHGIDIEVIGRDGTRVLVQCKRYGPDCWVGEREIRDLYGTLAADAEAHKAYLVTTGFFSQAARDWSERKPLVLIDGEGLAAVSANVMS